MNEYIFIYIPKNTPKYLVKNSPSIKSNINFKLIIYINKFVYDCYIGFPDRFLYLVLIKYS